MDHRKLVLCALVFPLLASCTPHFVLQDLRAKLERLRETRRALEHPAPYRDFAGSIHVHTELSHDSEGTLEEIAEASRGAGSSFVVTTDHHRPIVYEEGFQGWLEDVLFVRGSEIVKTCFGRSGATCDSVLVLGLDEHIEKGSIPMPEVVERIKRGGGWAFAAHPTGFVSTNAAVDGMEVYDILDDAVDKKWKFPKWFFDVLYSYGKYREEVFLSILDPPVTGLRKWDSLTRTRRVTGIAGNDSHQNQRYLGILLDPYDLTLKFVRTHVLAPHLDEEELIGALVAGHAYFSFDILADATGFGFWAEGGEIVGIMGDEVFLTEGLRLRVQAPLPGRIRVLRDGELIHLAQGAELTLPVAQAGVYRVEVFLDVRWRRWPWIYSNPIYIRD